MAVPVLSVVDVIQQSDSGYVIAWRAALPKIVLPGTTVTISRSYAENSGFVDVATVPITDGIYLDTDHRDTSKDLEVYYKLTVTAPSGTRVFGPYEVEGRPDVVARFAIRQVKLMLRHIGATPVLIYQEARGDETERCPECWDPITQMAVVSNCSTCGGSTFVGEIRGYYNPVLTLMDFRPSENVKVVEDTAQTPRTTTARMSNYPRLRIGDVVREVNTGRMWRVTAYTPVQKDQRALISQDPISLKEVKHGEIEYDLPVPATLVPVLKRRHARKERILRMVDGAPTLVDVWV